MVGVVLLGIYIGLMVVLVRIVGRRIAATATPYAILLISLSLVSMSYWLEPAVAYHQFLPVLFVVPILLLMRPTGHTAIRAIAIGVLGLLAGFAYISGAVLLLVMGFAFVAAYVRRWPTRADMLRLAPGMVIVATGMISAMSQVFLVGRAQGSLALSSSAVDSAYPWEPDFWAFYLGVAVVPSACSPARCSIYFAIFASTRPCTCRRRLHRPGPQSLRRQRVRSFRSSVRDRARSGVYRDRFVWSRRADLQPVVERWSGLRGSPLPLLVGSSAHPPRVARMGGISRKPARRCSHDGGRRSRSRHRCACCSEGARTMALSERLHQPGDRCSNAQSHAWHRTLSKATPTSHADTPRLAISGPNLMWGTATT